jgi:hypothetical protein
VQEELNPKRSIGKRSDFVNFIGLKHDWERKVNVPRLIKGIIGRQAPFVGYNS